MFVAFNNLHSVFVNSKSVRLHKYGFIIYFVNKIPLQEVNNIKTVIQLLGGSSCFFNSKLFDFNTQYYNCLAVTFQELCVVLGFPYYLDTIFLNFNYFPLYFKYYSNLIPINDNFLFKNILTVDAISTNTVMPTNANLNNILSTQRRRIFILFKFFFNSFRFLSYRKK